MGALVAVAGIFTPIAPAAVAVTPAEAAIRGAESPTAIAGSYIVTLKDNASVRAVGVEERARSLADEHEGTLGHVYRRALHGFSVRMSERQARRLAAEPGVAEVRQDTFLRLDGDVTQEKPSAWGIDRVDERALPLSGSYSYSGTASTVRAYIVDSGVRISHTEFEGRATYGYDAIDGDYVADDCNGHGTEVAGVVGGKTYGVAKKAKIVAVRVVDCSDPANPKAPESKFIAGLEWVFRDALSADGPTVVNISLGCAARCGWKSSDDAIYNLIKAGVPVIKSAGNEHDDACYYSSSMPGLISVGASNIYDQMWADSNWGSCVDIFAPGASIKTAGRGSDTDTGGGDGTSLAAPHVTGAAALILERKPTATIAELTNDLVNAATSGLLTNLGPGSPNKLLFTGAPPTAGGSSIAAARDGDGQLRLFAVQADSDPYRAGSLRYLTQTSSGASSWTPLSPPVWDNAYSVGAERNHNGDLVAVDLDRAMTWGGSRIYRHTQTALPDFWNTSEFDGAVTSAAVARNGDGRLEVFGVNEDGKAWNRWETVAGSDSWTNWSPFSYYPGTRLRSIAAETNGGGQIEVVALTYDNQIYQIRQLPGGGWSGWSVISGQLKSVAMTRLNDGRLALVGANAAGQVWSAEEATSTPGSWNPWVELSLAGAKLRSMAAETNVDGRVEVFGVDDSGNVWRRPQLAGGVTWSAWSKLIDGATSPIRP